MHPVYLLLGTLAPSPHNVHPTESVDCLSCITINTNIKKDYLPLTVFKAQVLFTSGAEH